MLLARPCFARTLTHTSRYFATAPSSKSSNVPYYLLGSGILGVGAWYHINSSASASAKMNQQKSPLNPEEFVDFKLKGVKPYNHNTSRFVFELPDDEASLIPIASCILVRPSGLTDSKGGPIIRAYTPVSPPNTPGELTLLVKRYENGNASKHIHSLKVGDTLSIKGPVSKFPYTHNEFEEVALIGGGSGITPLYQLITHALREKTNTTKFKLIYSNVSEQDILMREEFDALKEKYPETFDVVYLLDKPPQSWNGPSGYIAPDVIKQHVGPASLKEKIKIFVCGPPGQVAAVAGAKDGRKQGQLGGILKELGYSEDQVFKF